jgi:hypothetical protein
MPVLQEALTRKRSGWNVLPLRFNTKEALFAGKPHPFGEVELRHWAFRCRYGIGALLSEPMDGVRVMAVDCESPERRAWVEATWGPSNCVVATPGGGSHLYFRHDMPEQRSRIKFRGMDLDLKFTGHTCLPNTTIDGVPYRFEIGPQRPRDLRPFDPAWIREEVKSVVTRSFVATDQRKIDSAQRALDRRYSIAGAGGDLELFKVCCLLCQFYDLDEDTSLSLVRDWNADGIHCVPPWDDARLVYKIREARRLKK